MPLPTEMQFNIIIYALLAGILTGIMFDLYRIIRGTIVPKLIMMIEDILFWILAAMIVFSFLLYTNYAFLGVYVYVFMLLALAVYIRFISNTFREIELLIIRALGKVLRILFKDIIYPFKVLFSNITGKNN